MRNRPTKGRPAGKHSSVLISLIDSTNVPPAQLPGCDPTAPGAFARNAERRIQVSYSARVVAKRHALPIHIAALVAELAGLAAERP